MRMIARAAVVLALQSAAGNTLSAQSSLAWDKTFPRNPKVAHQKVTFFNRLGINLVADLYVPRNVDSTRRHPAIIVGHPYGAVKEQTSGLYAQTMAERGFVTLAFDASYNGESGGQPHFIASHEAFVEDLAPPWTIWAGARWSIATASASSASAEAADSRSRPRRSTRASRRSPRSACTTSARRRGRV